MTFTESLERADRFFMGKSQVHDAVRRIAAALSELKIPFAVAGALAVNAHGHRRETEDVDLLMTREHLAAFKAHWLGRGWVEKFPGSKGLRDVVSDVKVDVLLVGEYPGDGKPKPIAFPDPAAVPLDQREGYPVLPLTNLLELKIASGMTAAHRPRDLDDAIRLIKNNKLSLDFASKLHPYVQPKFEELWRLAQIEEDY